MKIREFYKKYSKFIYQSLGIVSILIIEEVVSLLVNDPLLFPGIDKIIIGLGSICSKSSFYSAFFESLLRTIVSILFSFIFAFIFGLLAGLFDKFRYFLSPIVGFFKLAPTPCVVFIIFLLTRGEANITSFVVTFLVIFPILYESFANGIVNIDENIKLSLRVEGYCSRKSIMKVIIPCAAPYLYLGVINSVGLGVKVSIMSEILVGSDSIWGLGRLIYAYKVNADFDLMIAMTFIIVIFFIFVDIISFSFKKILKK